MTSAVLRSAQAGAILAALGLSAGLMTGVAEAEPPRGEHFCTSPFSVGSGPEAWRNLNQRYGVSNRIIGPPAPAADDTPSPGCLEAFAGERWVRAVPPWLTANQAARDEFYNRFDHARYVIDEGTAQEKTVTAGKDILFQNTVPPGVMFPPPVPPMPDSSYQYPYVVPVSPALNPLSPTTGCVPSANPSNPGPCHTSTLYVTMTQGPNVCNGFVPPINAPGLGPVPGVPAGCLPGDETKSVETKWPILANWSFQVSTQPPPSPTSTSTSTSPSPTP